jgi:hypothetical protein
MGAGIMNLDYVTLVEDALEPVKKYLATTEPCEVVGNSVKYAQPYRSPDSGDRGIRMRLDYEISKPQLDAMIDSEDKNKHIAALMISQMSNDLADVLENGDQSSNDPLYKAFDGALKRQKEPSKVDIDYVQTFREYKKAKDAYEYTIFFTLYVEWEPKR